MSAPLIGLFHSDLKTHVALLEAALKQGNVQQMEAAARAIGGGARLVGYRTVSDLAKALEELKEIPKSAFEAVTLLKSLAESTLEMLPQAVLEKDVALKEAREALGRKEPVSSLKLPELIFDSSMMELFRTDLETQVATLTNGLVELERGVGTPELFEALMRAAHSAKGAARVVQLDPIVQLAHAIEEIFVAAQKQELALQPVHVDALLAGIDLIGQLTHLSDEEMQEWIQAKGEEIKQTAQAISGLRKGLAPRKDVVRIAAAVPTIQPSGDRILRVSAQNLNRLMGLAGESLVESRWLHPFGTSLLAIKKQINELGHQLDLLRETVDPNAQNERLEYYLGEAAHKVNESRSALADRLTELDLFIIRHSNLSDRLYREVIDSRMRPFSDGIGAFPRLVRDLARELGKKVRLELVGAATPVDRDILEKLEAPLSHLLRNAVDHGIELPEERGEAW